MDSVGRASSVPLRLSDVIGPNAQSGLRGLRLPSEIEARYDAGLFTPAGAPVSAVAGAPMPPIVALYESGAPRTSQLPK